MGHWLRKWAKGTLGIDRERHANTLWRHAYHDHHPTAIAVCEELLGASKYAAYATEPTLPGELVAKLSSKE